MRQCAELKVCSIDDKGAPPGLLPGPGPGPADGSLRVQSPPIRATVPGAKAREGEGCRDRVVRVVERERRPGRSRSRSPEDLPMNNLSPATVAQALVASSAGILAAAQTLLIMLERGQRVDGTQLRSAMETAFGVSDTSGAWDWKAGYEACEVATVLFLRKYGRALFRQAETPHARLAALAKIAGLLPSHTRRSEESEALQQFSTPIPLGFAAVTAAAITAEDVVLEPSAGTGLMGSAAGRGEILR